MNQKKAVDVLSKWPPKDRGTSFVNPRSLDVDFSSSQVLRQQRLSRLLHPRWKEPGQGPPGQHSGPILMDTLRLGVERCRKVSDGFTTFAGAARMGHELLQGGQARR